MKKRGTGPLFSFFGRTQKRCHAASKMKQRDTGLFFCRFCSTSKAVSRCIKNEAEGHRAFFFVVFVKRCHAASKMKHRALVKHRDARAGERHQLVGHQMNEQVRHRAVQALEGEPGKVAPTGADTTQRHLGHALAGKAGNEAVAQVAHAADVDVAHRVVVGRP